MRLAAGAAFLILNALAVGLLYWRGLAPGQVLGVVALFYLFILPCGILTACFIAPYFGGIAAMLVAAALSAWLAWSNVTAPGVAPELDEPATCFDRQGAHPC